MEQQQQKKTVCVRDELAAVQSVKTTENIMASIQWCEYIMIAMYSSWTVPGQVECVRRWCICLHISLQESCDLFDIERRVYGLLLLSLLVEAARQQDVKWPEGTFYHMRFGGMLSPK